MKRALKILGLVFGGAAILAATFYYGVQHQAVLPFQNAADELPKLKKEAAAVGLPLTADDLNHLMPLADADNGADGFKKARELAKPLIVNIKPVYYKWPSILTYGTVNERKEAIEAIKQCEPAFLAYSSSAEKRGIRMTVNWDKDPTSFVAYSDLKDAVKFCAARAEAKAILGEYDEALKSIDVAYKLSKALQYEPSLIGILVQLACYAITDDAGSKLATLIQASPGKIDALGKIAANGHLTVDLDWTVRSEFFYSYSQYEAFIKVAKMEKRKSPPPPPFGAVDIPFKSPIPASIPERLGLQAFEAREMECYVAGMKSYLKTRRFVDFVAGYKKAISNGVKSKDPSYSLINESFEIYDQTGKAVANYDARGNLLKALLEVIKFKQKVGRLPKDLAECNVFLNDPLGSGPLSYKVVNGVAIIYSVGRNGIDDGGNSTSNLDIVMTFPATIPRAH